jgi:hypothetical protein
VSQSATQHSPLAPHGRPHPPARDYCTYLHAGAMQRHGARCAAAVGNICRNDRSVSCQRPQRRSFCFRCDGCDGWFHLECVGLTAQATRAREYFCAGAHFASGLPLAEYCEYAEVLPLPWPIRKSAPSATARPHAGVRGAGES